MDYLQQAEAKLGLATDHNVEGWARTEFTAELQALALLAIAYTVKEIAADMKAVRRELEQQRLTK